MLKVSPPIHLRCAGWSLALLAGLAGTVGMSGCSTEKAQTPAAQTSTAPASTAPKTDPVLQPLVGSWEIDCGGFVQFKLVVAPDYSGKFDWTTFKEPGSAATVTNHMDLKLAAVGGVAEATVTRSDDPNFTGKKARLSVKDADSIVVQAVADGLVDQDATMYKESLDKKIDCGGD